MYIIRYDNSITACMSIGILLDTLMILARSVDSANDDDELNEFGNAIMGIQNSNCMSLVLHGKVELGISYLQPSEILLIKDKEQTIIPTNKLEPYLERLEVKWDGKPVNTTALTTTKGYTTLMNKSVTNDGCLLSVYKGYKVDT